MRYKKSVSMRIHLLPAVAVLLAGIFISGCSFGRPADSSEQSTNWPESPGKSAEETRAIREAEMAIYRDPKYSKREDPAPESSVDSSTGSARAPVGLGDEPMASRYGDLLFISGQLPVDAEGNALPPDAKVDDQARLALDNVRSVLEDNRLTMANVVSMTVYLRDLADLQAFDDAATVYFKGSMPSRSVVEVSRLPYNAALQVSAVAGR